MYKELRGLPYPVSEEVLGKRLSAVEVTAVPEPVEHGPELSDEIEDALAAVPAEEAE